MADAILSAIQTRQLNTDNISFDEIKRIAARDNDCWNQLGRGRAILTSTDELDQYLYSYGPMTKGQWNTFLGSASLPDDRNFRIVAYGCGQGLAASLVFDGFETALRAQTRQVVLIEPSVVALARARAVVSTYCPDATIHAVNEKLDDIKPEELVSRTTTPASTSSQMSWTFQASIMALYLVKCSVHQATVSFSR